MTDGGAAVVMFNHTTHRNRRHHASGDAGTLECITHRQRIHDSGQHAHVVAGDAIHAGFMQSGTPEQVATTEHQTYLHAHVYQLADLHRHTVQHLGINAEIGGTGQSFSAQFEQYAVILADPGTCGQSRHWCRSSRTGLRRIIY